MKGRQRNRPRGTGCEESFPGCNYTDEEREFLRAIDRYKRRYSRPHPTWREVLQVLRELGWCKPPAATGGAVVPSPSSRNEEGEG